jgi:hypothetical protein
MKIQSVQALLLSCFFISATQVFAVQNSYSLMGQYEGPRKDDSEQKLNLVLNFQKYNYTGQGLPLFLRIDRKKGEKEVSKDQFFMQMVFSPKNYAMIFESDEDLQNLDLGPQFEASPTGLYELNTLKANTDKATQLRTVSLVRTVGDKGRVTRKYLIDMTLKEGKIVQVAHKKYLKKVIYLFGDGFDLVADFKAENLKKVADGFELKEYDIRLKNPQNIESASEDSSAGNFERLADLEREVDSL